MQPMRRYTFDMRTAVLATVLLALPVVSTSPCALAQDAATQPAANSAAAKIDWKAELEQRRQALIAANGEGTDAAYRAALLKMRDEDQAARGLGPAQKAGAQLQIATNLNDIDDALTNDLKERVKAQGWPTIALVGLDASNAAMLILTHSRDHAWQESMLPQLIQLADQRKIDPTMLAILIDKQLVYSGQLQRYGTQFKRVEDGMAMYGVEDPANLDARREQLGLPPMAVYKAQLEAMYHLTATNQIVMAPTPAPAAAPK